MAWYKAGGGGTDTSDATLSNANELKRGVTAYSNDIKYTGTADTYDTVSSVPSVKATDIIYNTTDSSYYVWSRDNTPKIIPGGTATGVRITDYSDAEVATIKNELIAGGQYTAEDLDGASIFDITGTTVGTVILDVSNLGEVGDYIKLIHKLSNNTWETLFDGAIPSGSQVTVTLTEFSPIVGMESEPQGFTLTYDFTQTPENVGKARYSIYLIADSVGKSIIGTSGTVLVTSGSFEITGGCSIMMSTQCEITKTGGITGDNYIYTNSEPQTFTITANSTITGDDSWHNPR